jgi:hypothetical protein
LGSFLKQLAGVFGRVFADECEMLRDGVAQRMQFGGDGRQRLLQRAQGAFEFQQVRLMLDRVDEQV